MTVTYERKIGENTFCIDEEGDEVCIVITANPMTKQTIIIPVDHKSSANHIVRSLELHALENGRPIKDPRRP